MGVPAVTRAAVVLLLIGLVCAVAGSTLWFGQPALIAWLLLVGAVSLAGGVWLLLQDVEPSKGRDS